MLRIKRVGILAIFFTLVLATSACSSKKNKQAEMNPGTDLLAAESGADKVGSAQEDLLANEFNVAEQKPADPPKTSDPAAATSDAFNDLAKDAQETKDSKDIEMPLTEANSIPDAPPAQSAANDTYKVKAGDTLMKIAFSLYGDIDRWKEILEWNKEKLSKKRLSKGMTLKVETGGFQVEEHGHQYMIKKGDTLALIADDVYGRKQKYKKLQKYNAKLIKNPNVIFAGFTLYYDITDAELAEAEAKHKEKLAGANNSNNTPAPNPPQPIAAAPQAAAPAPAVAAQPIPSAVNPPAPSSNSPAVANNIAPPAQAVSAPPTGTK